ncbi:MAG: hypothetical protein ACRCV9_04260 [Burkholderiaceae bacterium]
MSKFVYAALVAMWLGCAASPAVAQQRSADQLATSINEIGFLRSAPQLAARAYLQLALNVEPKRASEAIALANKGFREGTGMARQIIGTDREGLANLEAYQRETEALLVLAAQPAEKQRVRDISERADRATNIASKVVDLALARLGGEAPRAVTSSGLQRTISLRLAKIELMHGLGLPIPAAEVAQLQNAFAQNLNYLGNSTLANDRIKAEVALARTQWIFMEKAIERVTSGAQAQRDMVIASDNVLRTMSGLTAMYEQELVRQLASNRVAPNPSRKS